LIKYLDFILEKYEKSEKEIFDDTIRQILRTYGSIPINKDKANEIIQRIIGSEVKYSKDSNHPSQYIKPVLGEDVNFNLMKSSNKVRIYEYLKSIIETKTIRGDSFEGLIAGLYNGELSKGKSTKYDVILYNGKKISVKFLDSIKERPVLGNIKTDIANFFKSKKSEFKYKPLNDLLNEIGEDNSFYLLNDFAFSDVDYFLFGYPSDVNLDINCLLMSKEDLIKRYIYKSDVRYAPKQKGSYQIRINIEKLLTPDTKNSNIHFGFETDKFWTLISPTITEKDIEYLTIDKNDTATKLFGTDKNRIRGSVLNSIVKFGEFKKVKGKEYFMFDFEKYKKERGY